MLKTRPPFHDTNRSILHILNPLPGIKRKSESDESSDCRSSIESPTRHSYVIGTRPRRTLPRRALSTSGMEIKSAALGMDVQPAKPLQSDLRKPTNTPPRSKSATSFRAFDRKDPVLPVPNIGSRHIYTPEPPTLLPFYSPRISISSTSSSRSIARKLNDLDIHHTASLRNRRSMDLRKAVGSSPRTCRPATSNVKAAGSRGPSRYFSDEEMHICTATEDENSDAESLDIRSAPTSAAFFRTIRLQQTSRTSEYTPSPAGRSPPQIPSSVQRTRFLNLLRPSNHSAPPPLVISDKCEPVVHHHTAKRAKRSRRGLAPPTHH